MYPVHGAAVAFFRGKFWVFGGSTGNDNYDHTITDKVSWIKFALMMHNRINFMTLSRKLISFASGMYFYCIFMNIFDN